MMNTSVVRSSGWMSHHIFPKDDLEKEIDLTQKKAKDQEQKWIVQERFPER